MSIFNQINNDIKEAMKAKDRGKLDALRGVKSALLLASTEKGSNGSVDDASALKIIQKLVKQRRDSAEIFIAQNRNDLAQPETLQADIIEAYLPKQMSEQEIEHAVQQTIAQLGASGLKDMGKVMGVLSKELSGKADGKIIADTVKKLLA